MPVASPGQAPDGRRPMRGHIDHGSTRLAQRQHIGLAPGGAEIAHQPADERHALAVRRDFRLRQLLLRRRRRVEKLGFGTRRIESIEFRDPPMRVAISGRRGADKTLPIGPPIIFVDEQIRRRGEMQFSVVAQFGHTLLMHIGAEHARLCRPGLDRADLLGRPLGGQHRHLAPRPITQIHQRAAERQALGQRTARRIGRVDRMRMRARRAQHEGQFLAIRRPGQARGCAFPLHSARQFDRERRAIGDTTYDDRLDGRRAGLCLIALDGGHAFAIRRNRHRQKIMHRCRRSKQQRSTGNKHRIFRFHQRVPAGLSGVFEGPEHKSLLLLFFRKEVLF